ncbi:MAG: head-tail connector protein [Desulfosporosinus sp.]
MALALKTAPATEPITLAEAKLYLHADDSTVEDTLITAFITAAREYCEDYQNRAYVTQTWELWLDDWPDDDFIRIPLSPLRAANSIKYYDTANAVATMTATDYFVDTKSNPGRVSLTYGMTWPTTTLRPANGVVIEFEAGYGAVAAVPQTVKQAMLLHLSLLYEPCDAERGKQLTRARDALLGMRRVVPV